MYDSVVLVGQAHLEERRQAYGRLLGEPNVRTAGAPDQVPAGSVVVDLDGAPEEKRWISRWREQGAWVITTGLPAATVTASRELLLGGRVMMARLSRYDPRYELFRKQMQEGQIGRLVAARLVRAWPVGAWPLGDVVSDYAPDALDALSALMGGAARIMAREQCLAHATPDMLFATLVGENRAIGYLELGAACPAGAYSERVEVVGDQGMIEYNSDTHRTLRLVTLGGAALEDAFHESSWLKMARAHWGCLADPGLMAQETAQSLACLDLVERAQQSAQLNRPA